MTYEPQEQAQPRVSRVLVIINIILPLLIIAAAGTLVFGLFFRDRSEPLAAATDTASDADCIPTYSQDRDGIHISLSRACGPVHIEFD